MLSIIVEQFQKPLLSPLFGEEFNLKEFLFGNSQLIDMNCNNNNINNNNNIIDNGNNIITNNNNIIGSDSDSNIISDIIENDGDNNIIENQIIELRTSAGLNSSGHKLKPDEVLFYTGNPTVESTKGRIHLFTSIEKLPSIDSDLRSDLPYSYELPEQRSNLVCILSVPRWMSPSEFCDWIKKYAGVQEMRIVKGTAPEYYMVVAKFHNQTYADNFYIKANGKTFNSVEPERCAIVFVREVTFIEPVDGVLFPRFGLKEIPSCPVCLERLDSEETGLITSICNHQFHTHCLSECKNETSCPVCRYTLQPHTEKNRCFGCDATENLWICLLCGHIGCSRYQNEHAEIHFKDTQHTYSLEIDTQRVWDYAGDGYVHRLIQNKADGKLVEITQPHYNATDNKSSKDHEKTSVLAIEYNYLLTTQLESQRLYFENIIKQMRKEHDEDAKKLTQTLSTLAKEKEIIEHVAETSLQEKKMLERKLSKLTTKLSKAQSELSTLKKDSEFLREINLQLAQNQEKLQQKIKEGAEKCQADILAKNQEIQDLENQVRDLMLHLEGNRIASSDQSDIKDGSLIINAPNPLLTPNNNLKKKRKGKR